MSDRNHDHSTKQRILDAALVELTTAEIGAFTLESVAARAAINLATVRDYWANANVMYSAALNAWFERSMPVPDTGTLRGDWIEFSQSFVTAFNSPVGRRVLGSILVSARDWDIAGLRDDFHQARTARVSVMVQRAIDRGECVEGTDPVLLADLLRAGMSMPMTLRGELLSEGHAEKVIGILLNGVLRR